MLEEAKEEKKPKASEEEESEEIDLVEEAKRKESSASDSEVNTRKNQGTKLLTEPNKQLQTKKEVPDAQSVE